VEIRVCRKQKKRDGELELMRKKPAWQKKIRKKLGGTREGRSKEGPGNCDKAKNGTEEYPEKKAKWCRAHDHPPHTIVMGKN